MKKLSLDRFMTEFTDPLGEMACELFRPSYQFNIGPLAAVFNGFSRKLIGIQKHSAAALYTRLRNWSSAILCGEMGSGKTAVSIAVAISLARMTKSRKFLVVCPPHLVEKWAREISAIVPWARHHIVECIADLEQAAEDDLNGSSAEFFIVSKERAKYSYEWTPALHPRYEYSKHHESARCRYVCPQCFMVPMDENDVVLSRERLETVKCFCHNCGSALWSARRLNGGKGAARISIAKYISSQMPHFFDLLIADECHQFKDKNSAQGEAVGVLAECCKKSLFLTGTLFSGRASSIFHILFKADPSIRKEFAYSGMSRFVERFGVNEKVISERQDQDKNGEAYTVKTIEDCREMPGCSPDLIRHVLDKAVFLRLSDISDDLPSFKEYPEIVDMTNVQSNAYIAFQQSIMDSLRSIPPDERRTVLGGYLQSMLTYPDQPFALHRVISPGSDEVIASSSILSSEEIYPKERRLIDICLDNQSRGRKVIVYCTHTNIRDVTGRLEKILSAQGLRTAVVKAKDANARSREDFLNQLSAQNIDVLILNPRLVEVGLDLISFPTLVYYEVEYSVFTLRQSSRRSWRIGQTRPVEVHYLCYKGTYQEKALSLVAELTRASVSFDGEVFDLKSLAGFNLKSDNVMKTLADRILTNGSFDDLNRIFESIRKEESGNNQYLSPSYADKLVAVSDNSDAVAIGPMTPMVTYKPAFPPEVFKSGSVQLSLF